MNPVEQAPVPPRDEVAVAELWQALWRSKWQIAAVVALAAAAAVVYALTAPEWYRAEVVLSTPEESNAQGILGQLGGLAGLAGVNLTNRNNSVESLAILRSRDFTRKFIEEEGLLPVLYAENWDEQNKRWKVEDPEEQPDIRDAVRLFERTVRSVNEDRTTGLITVAIEWRDPETAAQWANRLVERVNDHIRQRALLEAEANVEYLRREMSSTSLVTLQQSIGSLLENELQKLMLARQNKEFAFKVIDSAVPPRLRSRPRRTRIVLLTVAVAGVLASMFVIVRHSVSRAS